MKTTSRNHIVHALAGTQAGEPIYTYILPLSIAAQHVEQVDEKRLTAGRRKQRDLNPNRAKAIGEYIADNQETYCLPAVTVSIDGATEFSSENGSGSGQLKISTDAKWYPNDGQHRLEGIRTRVNLCQAVLAAQEPTEGDDHERQIRKFIQAGKHADLAAAQQAAAAELDLYNREHIVLTAYISTDKKRIQQRFADINKNASKPNTALLLTFDHRDPIAEISRKLCRDVAAFKGRIEQTKPSVSRASDSLFTINAIAKGVRALGEYMFEDPNSPSREEYAELVEFFDATAAAMPDWKLKDGELAQARSESLAVQNVALEAICTAFAPQDDWKAQAKHLKTIDWSRSASHWKRANVVIDGTIQKSKTAIGAAAATILKHCKRQAKQ